MLFDKQGRHDSRWSAIMSISAEIGCAPRMLNERVGKTTIDHGEKAGMTIEMADPFVGVSIPILDAQRHRP